MLTKTEKRHRNLKRLSVVCFFVAIILFVLSRALMLPEIQRSLAEINDWFLRIENFIARYDVFMAFTIIMVLFLFKSILPIIPFSVLFIASGMVFNPFVAVLVNALGFVLMTSVKFLWGKKFGGGRTHKILGEYKRISEFMRLEGKGNKWLLVVLCFIPFLPVGTVSRAYGATKMRHSTFSGLAVLGFLPRLISWSVVGINIFNPFTPTFIAPFIVLLIISGLSLLVLNVLLD